MDIEAVFGAVQDALEGISTYPEVKTVAKHPDVWKQQAATFPICSLVFSQGDFEHESGDKLWSETTKTRVEFEIHLIITTSTDSLSLEFMSQFAAIQNKIKALTQTAAFNALARAYIANVQTAHAETGAWLWAVMRLVVGE
jgi:hypothetical protein